MGLRTSVSGVASSLIGLLRTRLELLALEAAEEKTRLVKVLGMAFAALLFVTLAVLVFTVMVAVAFWPTENRYMALGVLAAVYAVLGIGLLLALRRQLLFGPVPFAATIEELGRDADLLARVRAAREEGDEDSDDASDEGVAHSEQSARARRVAAARQVGS
ncbi:phage holin family protein [Bordetella sp. 02P26C-1]|nr:phage holin family protein [Bordetella sp. 02P26C-1]MVW79550.1 phage holin family protein [Bordetella sp. 02P26C-1]